MKVTNLEVLFDDGGGITVQGDQYVHNYDDPRHAAADVSKLLNCNADPADWDGNDPQWRIEDHSGYKVFNVNQIERCAADPKLDGWRNVDEFMAAYAAVGSEA